MHKMKSILFLSSLLVCTCTSSKIHVISKSKNESIDTTAIAVFFAPHSINFYFDRPMLSTKNFRSPTGIIFDSTELPVENFKELFVHYAKKYVRNFSVFKDIVLSSNVDNSYKTIITEWGDSITVPMNGHFIQDYSDIEYAIIFDKFDIIYTDCGRMFSTMSGKCAPELQMIVSFKIISNKGEGLIQYGRLKEYYEYIKPQTGQFSKPDPSFINVRYLEWEALIKLVLKKIFNTGPCSK